MGDFYDKMTGKAYDDFLTLINFCDPQYVSDVIAKAAPAEEDTEMSYGLLKLARDAKVFDMAQGTGVMGRLLTEQGFTNIDGADASLQFVNTAQNSGWY